MDPKNPRWESSDTRVARSALFWKVVVSAAAAAALTTAIVVSCLDRVAERRASSTPPEPAYVETVATAHAPPAAPPTAPATAGTSTADSTGGIAEAPPAARGGEPASTTRVTSTTIIETKTPADASAAATDR